MTPWLVPGLHPIEVTVIMKIRKIRLRTSTAALAAFLALILNIILAAAPCAVGGTPFPDYRTASWFLPYGPGVTGGPAAGLFNPGAFGITPRAGSDLWYRRDTVADLDSYGFAVGRTLNFAVTGSEFVTGSGTGRVWDYQLGLAGGDAGRSFGVAYRWAGGDTGGSPRQNSVILGSVARNRWLSFGASSAFSLQSGAAQYVFDLGLRPLGGSWLTLSGDYTLDDGETFLQDGTWGAGLELRPLRGVSLGVRARERAGGDVDLVAVAGVTVGRTGFWGLPGFDRNGDALGTGWLVRSDPPRAAVDPRVIPLRKGPWYRTLDLEHKVLSYQKYRLFDDRHLPWLDLLPRLEAMRDDPRLDIVAVNLSGFSGRPSLLWELRKLLDEIRASGKTVLIHADRLSAGTLYVASAADRLSLDPQGRIVIPGVALSRSYLKGTLEKLGLGFQAHRYLKYKSAAETLSRDHMSAADREQRDRIVEVAYDTWRKGIAAGRGLATASFDSLVDRQAWLTAPEALAAGLVDTLGRWDDLVDGLERVRGARPVPADAVAAMAGRDDWGRPVRIPVVYTVGACAMDEGIKGRATSRYLRSLIHDPEVKAVVLRVDSPGGEPLPSDLIAGAVADLRKAGKPVVVSQGDVAASGGYWLSMNGSEILTTPLTVTGSIGVISGWLWDDGFAAKLGVTADEVHRGAHADLFAPVSIPLLGNIPRRPMNEDELGRMRELIMGMYEDFTARVASGRGLDQARVDSVAQGRVWMGQDALARGLCDRVGGLSDAVRRARALAGIPEGRPVELVEYPRRPLVRMPSVLPRVPSLFGLEKLLEHPAAQPATVTDEPETPAGPLDGLPLLQREFLRAVAAAPGQPLVLTDPDLLPVAWQDPR